MKKSYFKKIKQAFMFRLARRLPDCKTITPTLSESLDRRFSLREKIIMRLHLLTCSFCTRYVDQIKFLSDAMHRHDERLTGEENTGVQMASDAKNKLKSALKSAASSAF